MSVKMCAVRIPEAIAARYDDLARRTGRTKTFYLRQALESHIEDMEDAYEGSVIMERVKRGAEELISLEEWEETQKDASDE
jgi:RHH-type rel operon transcriptional repressor/antitoxin RelB